MEFYWILLILLFIVSFLIISKLLKKPTTTKLPPGPPKLPLIGNLHQLASKTTLPHRRLAELATVYGPIMHLRLGEVPTIVISSAEMAKEVMKTHDALLCNRPKMMMPQVVFYNCSDIALTPYGEYWRQVRKIATLELFTASRVQVFRPIREEEVRDVVKSLASKVGSVVNLSNTIFTLTFNITLRVCSINSYNFWRYSAAFNHYQDSTKFVVVAPVAGAAAASGGDAAAAKEKEEGRAC
ncbi:hypothetical protein BVRB_8g191000 [Beta vulgaris subsp. vulgaris]|nr:hypothetical protein BVRB_8g191000 [Beta vulgaris subsp. vulgaris]